METPPRELSIQDEIDSLVDAVISKCSIQPTSRASTSSQKQEKKLVELDKTRQILINALQGRLGIKQKSTKDSIEDFNADAIALGALSLISKNKELQTDPKFKPMLAMVLHNFSYEELMKLQGEDLLKRGIALKIPRKQAILSIIANARKIDPEASFLKAIQDVKLDPSKIAVKPNIGLVKIADGQQPPVSEFKLLEGTQRLNLHNPSKTFSSMPFNTPQPVLSIETSREGRDLKQSPSPLTSEVSFHSRRKQALKIKQGKSKYQHIAREKPAPEEIKSSKKIRKPRKARESREKTYPYTRP